MASHVPESRPRYQPSAAHPITVEPTGRRVTVRVDGEVIAQTDAALTLTESTYPPVQYLPLADASSSRLRRSGNTTYCPYKGDAGYFHVVRADGTLIEDAVWVYETPYPAVADIAGRIAFYPDKIEITVAD